MKQRKRLMKRMISIILTFVMVVGTGLGIVPRSTITAKADEVVSIYMQNGFPDGTLMKGESKWNDNDGDNYYFDLSEGNYKLTGDIATKFEIRVKGNVTLDLNGFGIFYKSDYEPVIRIIDNGNLTIIDKNPNTEHYITLSNGRASQVSVVENIQNGDEQTNQSVIKVNGGYITGGAGKYGGSVTYGGGVFVDNGELNLKGGTVAGNSAARGAGIYIAENGKVNIEEGAAISHNRAASMGAGIYVDATSDARGSLNMTGGTISENTFTDSAYGYGGGVYLAGDFTMSGGTISNHDVTGTSGKNGAGVYIGNNSYLAKATNGRFTMTGGTIENNTAQLGGGVIVNTDDYYKNAAIKPTFTLSGGSIINNVAKYTGSGSNAGGGIYISQNESCTFNLSGSPVISGNKLIKGNNEPVDDNIFAGLGITIVGQLDISNNKKPFGVSQSEYNISNYTITKGWSVYNVDKNPWDYFTSELAKYYVDEKSQSDVTEALFAPLWSIEVSAPSGIKHKEDSGAETQLVKSGNPQPIDDVIYTADEDHYFQENYTSGVIYSNTYSYPATSFSVTRDSNSQITISGTPVGATKITLPAPTEKAAQETPAAPEAETIGLTSITLKTVEGCEYGRKSDTGDEILWQDSPAFTDLTKATHYTFYQRVKGDDTHKNSEPSEAVISTLDHTHDWSFEANGATITATCADTDRNHGDNKTATLTINVPELKSFGGEGSPEASITGSIDGVDTPDIVYKKGNQTLENAPMDAGTYTASITLGNATASLEYTIAKATAPTLTGDQKPEAKSGLKYKETETGTGTKQPLVTAPTADAPSGYTVKYSLDGNDWSEDIPTGKDAGAYTVKVKYEGDNNHEDFNGEDIAVTIAKADQSKPDAAPTATDENIGSNSITLNTVEGCEYGIKSGDSDVIVWQESLTFTGLNKNTEYTFYQRCAEDTNHNASPESESAKIKTSDHSHDWSFEANGAVITATCADTDGGHGETKTSALVLNKPALTVYGGTGSKVATVTGSIEGVDNPAIVYKEGDKILTTAPTDAGTYTANITLGDAAASVEYTIAKAAAPALTDGQKPVAVTELIYDSEPHGLVIVPTDNIPDGYTLKYSTDNGTTWTTEIPTGTDAGDYTVKVKYEGDKNHTDIEGTDINVKIDKQSQEALDVPVTTKASSAVAADGTVSPVDNTMEYSLDGEKWTAVTPDAEGKVMLPAGEYSLRKKGDNNHEPSKAVSFTIGVKEEQTAPDKANITVTNASDENVSDGKITGVDDTMEYSSVKDTAWTPVETGKTVIDNLSEGDYEIRKKGDEDHNPSEPVKVTIGVTSRTQGVVEFKNKEGSTNAETGVKSAESSNIDAYAVNHFEEGKDVELKLEVKPVKEENVAAASVTGNEKATEKLFAAIDKTMVASDYIEIDLAKYVDSEKTGNITDTGTPLEIELDYDTDKIKSVPVVVRTHDGTTRVFDRLNARPESNYKDATYYAENGKIYLYSQYFSDFALVYAKLKSYYVTIDTGVGEATVSFISEGSSITLPENPAKDGYNFSGWYTDPEGKTAWNKDTDKVSKDLNIYAGWDKAVDGVTASADKGTLTNIGETAQISVVVSPDDAANKKVAFTSSDPNVATVDANGTITAIASGTAVITVTTEDGAKTASVTINVNVEGAVTDYVTTEDVIEVKDNVIRDDKNSVAMNSGFKLDQTASKLKVAWGRVKEADGYELYVTYCGTKFGEVAKEINNNKITSATVTKINGKKLNLKKNYKLYIAAYKIVDGNKVRIANTIVGHVVGRKNTKYTNVKKVTVKKSKYTIKVGKTAKIKAKTVLVQKGKKQLSNAHAAQFRYLSINKDVATVNKNGKIKGIAAGTTTIYVYARNGYAKKIKVTVK